MSFHGTSNRTSASHLGGFLAKSLDLHYPVGVMPSAGTELKLGVSVRGNYPSKGPFNVRPVTGIASTLLISPFISGSGIEVPLVGFRSQSDMLSLV